MASASKEPLLEILRRSGLVEEREIDRLVESHPQASSDSAIAADVLAASKLVTSWQLDRLREGRWKGYFLGKYKILRQLGAGAMGSVFLAEHRVMRHQVAIKVLARRLTGKPEYVKRFEQEARAAAAVSHPRLVRAFDIDSEGDLQYFVMEFVPGEDLQKIVLRDGPLPIAEAAECIRQTAEGLDAAHAAGLIHRDIKPSNLLLDEQGQVHILDLGLARMVIEDEPSLTLLQDAKMIGTVDYLSPEQARNSHEIDPRADQYSLGCTLYFLLTGQPPFSEGTIPQRVIAHQTRRPPSIRKKRAEVDAGLAAILSKLLEKQPEQRFASAQQVHQAIALWQRSPADAVHALVGPAASAVDDSSGGASDSQHRAGSSLQHDSAHHQAGSHAGGSHTAASHPASSSAAVSRSQAGDELTLLPLDGHDTDPAASLSGRSTLSPSHSHASAASKALPASSSATGSAARKKPAAVPSPSKQSAAKPEAVPEPLSDGASLTELPAGEPLASLVDELPPLPEFDPLASASLLDAAPLVSSTTLAAAVSPASLAADQNQQLAANSLGNKTIRERLLSLVASEGDGLGGLSYSLWFLILFGISVGLIVATVGYSYVQSFANQPAPVERSIE